VAADAQLIAVRAELRVSVDVGQMRVAMTGGAGRAPLEEALALPEADRVVGETARPAVGPVGRDESGKVITPDVKAGDVVLFGKWSGTEVKLHGEEFLIMQESDIIGVLA